VWMRGGGWVLKGSVVSCFCSFSQNGNEVGVETFDEAKPSKEDGRKEKEGVWQSDYCPTTTIVLLQPR
jgi:hypothetical protein